MIEFISYENIANGHYTLNYAENGKNCSANFSLKKMVGFLRDKVNNKDVDSCADFSVAYEKYPYLKYFAEELNRALPPLSAKLLIVAIEKGDDTLSDYMLKRFGLTEETLKKRTVDCFEKLNFLYRAKGKDCYEAIYEKWWQKTPRDVLFDPNDDFCRTKEGRRVFLSEQSKKQLVDSHAIVEQAAKNILAGENGYNMFEFNGKRLYIKIQDINMYEVWAFQTSGEEIVEIRKLNLSVEGILGVFGLDDIFESTRWMRLYFSELSKCVTDAIADGSFSLLQFAKAMGNKYLEYELKFWAETATDDEIDYLEKISRRNRFLPHKDIYDVDDVKIISMDKIRKTYFNRMDKWFCHIVIGGFERVCVWCKGYKSLEFHIFNSLLYPGYSFKVCTISQRLADEFEAKANITPAS